jgi:3-deoxy-D-manno-octulosonic-acid transferase
MLLPFIFMRLGWRGLKAKGYLKHWKERLGFVTVTQENPVWFHAVSLGETRAAVPLIQALLNKHVPVFITNMTPTGRGAVEKTFGSKVENAYIPYDTLSCVKRFLNRVKPRQAIILETEIWPNLFYETILRDIPIYMVNARLSPKSFHQYTKIRFLMAPLLKSVKVATQSEVDTQRFLHLGAEQVKICGNIKYDVALPSDISIKTISLQQRLGERSIWIAVSTHRGEEDKILTAHRQIQTKVPDALLILVPRHPERFLEVERLCQEQGLSVVRQSQSTPVLPTTDVFLGDTLGQLLLLLSVSQAAFVGGSLEPIGGHNALEAALLKLPITMGPYTFKCTDTVTTLIQAGGLVIVLNPEELAGMITTWLLNPDTAREMGEKAYQVIENNRGVLGRLLDFLDL